MFSPLAAYYLATAGARPEKPRPCGRGQSEPRPWLVRTQPGLSRHPSCRDFFGRTIYTTAARWSAARHQCSSSNFVFSNQNVSKESQKSRFSKTVDCKVSQFEVYDDWANNLFQISTLCLGLAAAMSNVTTEVSEAYPAVTVGYGVAQPVLATKDVVILVNIPTLSHLPPPVPCVPCRCSCSCCGPTPCSSPTAPGTASSTRTGTRDPTCGGQDDT